MPGYFNFRQSHTDLQIYPFNQGTQPYLTAVCNPYGQWQKWNIGPVSQDHYKLIYPLLNNYLSYVKSYRFNNNTKEY